jgi:hypothetical protein
MLDIDTAIKHCLEVAEQNETQADKWQEEGGEQWGKTIACRECAKEHRQLAEWLTELKEAKRLLKAAVEDFSYIGSTGTCIGGNCERCPLEGEKQNSRYACTNWKHADEALALIGEDTNVPASADDTNVGHKSGGWISCKDRMPEVNEPVLFIFNTESGFKAVMYGWHETIKGLGSGWHQAGVGGARADEEVTHWMPLPEPPKE